MYTLEYTSYGLSSTPPALMVLASPLKAKMLVPTQAKNFENGNPLKRSGVRTPCTGPDSRVYILRPFIHSAGPDGSGFSSGGGRRGAGFINSGFGRFGGSCKPSNVGPESAALLPGADADAYLRWNRTCRRAAR